MVEKAQVNPLDSFSPSLKYNIAAPMLTIDPMGQHSEIASEYISGSGFQSVTSKELAKQSYDKVNRARRE